MFKILCHAIYVNLSLTDNLRTDLDPDYEIKLKPNCETALNLAMPDQLKSITLPNPTTGEASAVGRVRTLYVPSSWSSIECIAKH